MAHRVSDDRTWLLAVFDPPVDDRARKLRVRSGVGETYLDAVEVEPDDACAVDRFVRAYGRLGIATEDFAAVRRFPGFDTRRSQLVSSFAAEQITSLNRTSVFGSSDSWDEPMAVFEYGLECLRNLAMAARAVLHEQEPEAPWFGGLTVGDILGGEGGAYLAEQEDAAGPLDQAAAMLESGLTCGIRTFQPAVISGSARERGRPWFIAGINVSLYEYCCAEIYNHLLEGAMFKVCEKCGKVFVRQSGRARAGQNRLTGVRYCSSYCGNAAQQKRLRDRARAGRDLRPES